MVRTYKPKKNRLEISKEAVKSAIENVINKTMSVRAAAMTYGIRKSTLQDYVAKARKRQANIGDSGNESDENDLKCATRKVFTNKEEEELEIYLKESSKIFYGLTYKATRVLAYEYAQKLGKKYPINWDNEKIAGWEWMRSFMKRHPRLSYRKPENTSIARASAFNVTNVKHFFSNYIDVHSKYNFAPHRIWNTDETGIQTVLQAPKVIAETGSRGVGQCVSAERGTLVTMCGIVSAVGSAIPPIYMFPRIRMKEQFMYGAAAGAVGYAEKSGWMSSTLFIKLLEHIKEHSHSTPEDPILLLMDNHETHTSLEAINFARTNGIVLLSFPPHCTHRMQPLDRGIYGPFKAKCKQSFNDYIMTNPGKPITIYDIAKLTAEPYLQSFTPKNITSSFRSTGLWPINTMIFADEDYSGAYSTDRPNPEVTNVSFQSTSIGRSFSVSGSFNAGPNEESLSIVTSILDQIFNEATKCNVNIISSITIKPSDIKPLPKAGPRKTNNKSKLGKSRIYTSTPEKDRIEELEKARLLKLDKSKIKRKITEFKEKNKEEKPTKKQQKISKDGNKAKKQKKDETSSSDSDVDLSANLQKKSRFDMSDSDIDMGESDLENMELLDDEEIVVGDYVLENLRPGSELSAM